MSNIPDNAIAAYESEQQAAAYDDMNEALERLCRRNRAHLKQLAEQRKVARELAGEIEHMKHVSKNGFGE